LFGKAIHQEDGGRDKGASQQRCYRQNRTALAPERLAGDTAIATEIDAGPTVSDRGDDEPAST
jgi:hypothetical protein